MTSALRLCRATDPSCEIPLRAQNEDVPIPSSPLSHTMYAEAMSVEDRIPESVRTVLSKRSHKWISQRESVPKSVVLDYASRKPIACWKEGELS